jgi:hypothetical protein
MMMERVGDRWEKMEGYCSTGQSQQWAVVPVEKKKKKKNITHVGLHGRTRYSCHILMKLEFSILIFQKYSNIRLQRNPSDGRAELFHADGRT